MISAREFMEFFSLYGSLSILGTTVLAVYDCQYA